MPSSLYSLCRGWRAALLLVAVVCASPGRATAGCGDHVVVLNAGEPVGAASHAAPAPGAVEFPGPKAPCPGPNCSNAPDHHATPVAPVPTSGPHAKGVAEVLASPGLSDRASLRLCDFMTPSPIRRASSIFHPPRAG